MELYSKCSDKKQISFWIGKYSVLWLFIVRSCGLCFDWRTWDHTYSCFTRDRRLIVGTLHRPNLIPAHSLFLLHAVNDKLYISYFPALKADTPSTQTTENVKKTLRELSGQSQEKSFHHKTIIAWYNHRNWLMAKC